jgi:hypothetical protein
MNDISLRSIALTCILFSPLHSEATNTAPKKKKELTAQQKAWQQWRKALAA